MFDIYACSKQNYIFEVHNNRRTVFVTTFICDGIFLINYVAVAVQIIDFSICVICSQQGHKYIYTIRKSKDYTMAVFCACKNFSSRHTSPEKRNVFLSVQLELV